MGLVGLKAKNTIGPWRVLDSRFTNYISTKFPVNGTGALVSSMYQYNGKKIIVSSALFDTTHK